MWRLKSHTAVFVPKSPEGSRVAFSHKQLHSPATVNVSAAIRFEQGPAAPCGGAALRCTGALELRGPQARLLFRSCPEPNALRPDHGIIRSDSACAPDPPRVQVPERVLKALGDPRPFVWIAFEDRSARVLSATLCLGRIERGPLIGERNFSVPASISVLLAAQRFDPRRGPVVDLSGELSFPNGITLVIRFAPECDWLGAPAGRVEIARIPVLPPGVAIPIARTELTPGDPHHPEVSLVLRDLAGAEAGAEMPVGRCVNLD